MSVEMSNFQNFNNFPENTIEENRYAKKLKGKSCTWSICWEFCIQKQCLYMQSSKKVNCVQNVFVQIVDVYATLKDPVFWPICKMRTATSICRILCISSTWITNLPTMDWWVLDHSCLIKLKRLLSRHSSSLNKIAITLTGKFPRKSVFTRNLFVSTKKYLFLVQIKYSVIHLPKTAPGSTFINVYSQNRETFFTICFLYVW